MASSISSAVALVEAGVQEDIGDACSICLETFSEEEPSTATTCGHQYHLQCILEWAQRRSECPLCWQALGLQDETAAELLAGIESDRAFLRPSSAPSSFYRRPGASELGYEFSEEGELERRIMQHLAAAAAGMSRARLMAASNQRGEARARERDRGRERARIREPEGSNQAHNRPPPHPPQEASQALQADISRQVPRSASIPIQQPSSSQRSVGGPSSPGGGAGSVDSFKSRLAAASSRYKESLSKTTRGFRWLVSAFSGGESSSSPSSSHPPSPSSTSGRQPQALTAGAQSRASSSTAGPSSSMGPAPGENLHQPAFDTPSSSSRPGGVSLALAEVGATSPAVARGDSGGACAEGPDVAGATTEDIARTGGGSRASDVDESLIRSVQRLGVSTAGHGGSRVVPTFSSAEGVGELDPSDGGRGAEAEQVHAKSAMAGGSGGSVPAAEGHTEPLLPA